MGDTTMKLYRTLFSGLLAASLLAGLHTTVMAADEAPPAGEDNMAGMPDVPPGDGQHPLCWIEITSKDVPASQAFYRTVFGWEMMEEDSDYPMFSPPAGLSGAFAPPRPNGQGA